MSITSKPGVGAASTRSDEEGKHTAVRVGMYHGSRPSTRVFCQTVLLFARVVQCA